MSPELSQSYIQVFSSSAVSSTPGMLETVGMPPDCKEFNCIYIYRDIFHKYKLTSLPII
jgi:hypothetical protein